MKNLLLIFTALKMHEIKIKEFDKRSKNLSEYDPDSIWAQLSVPQAKVKNSAFWNIVNSVVCQNSIALISILTSKEAFKISKSAETVSSKGPS